MDKELEKLKRMHLELHAYRLTKPSSLSPFERNIIKIILEQFSNQCPECKESELKMRYAPQESKSFLGGLFK